MATAKKPARPKVSSESPKAEPAKRRGLRNKDLGNGHEAEHQNGPPKPEKIAPDWEAIEREYRAGQLSVREIGRRFGVDEKAIRKRADKFSWVRALAEKVRAGVREKLVREDGPQDQRTKVNDEEAASIAIDRGFAVVTSHRKDITQLHALKRILATRLADILQGVEPDGPCLGEKESPSDLLEKLSRVTSRLVPLERQAHSLDEAPADVPAKIGSAIMSASRFEEIARQVVTEI